MIKVVPFNNAGSKPGAGINVFIFEQCSVRQLATQTEIEVHRSYNFGHSQAVTFSLSDNVWLGPDGLNVIIYRAFFTDAYSIQT